jgi:hypothetical protein
MSKNITKLKHRSPFRQLRQIPKFFDRTWPIFALLLITTILAFLNYEPNTQLLGWDNLSSELAPALNLKRALFSVWQEYQSLGLLGGMAHAADLPRVLFIFFLSLIPTIPISFHRYLFTFIPLVIGPISTYLFLYHRLFKNKLDSRTSQFASFLGGLFYLLNLSTLQTFFTPFESFTVFYGSFPLLLFLITGYLEKPKIKSLVTIFIMSFLSAPSFYVETIFLVFILCLISLFSETLFTTKKKSFSKIFKVSLALITPHFFWLLPVIFFVATNGGVGSASKINLISTPETYYRNLDFGNFKDLALLKGFWFNFLDLGINNKFDYLLSIWRTHTGTPIINIFGYTFFGLALTGLYYSFKKKFPWTIGLTGVLFTSIFFLIGGGLLINNTIPLIGEIFRSPFTKFSTPLTFAYACFFAVGTVFLLDLFSFLHSRLTYYLTLFTVTVALLIFMSPAFSGNLISTNMRLNLPEDYLELFSYLKTQDPAKRIANFPQYTFWGWNYYDWGYRGSGFLWYGIKQPILDRAFDVWEKSSERYYEEISSALFSGNQKAFENTVDKYNISWILLDKHVIPPDSQTDLGNNTLEKFLTSSSKFSLNKSFSDQIFLYQVTTNPDQKEEKNFLSVSPLNKVFHPFDSLSLRPNTDWIEKSGFLSINAPLSQTNLIQETNTLNIPSLTESESLLPIKVDYQKIGQNLTLRLTPVVPIIFAGSDQIDLAIKPTFINIPVGISLSSFILQLDKGYFSFDLPAEIPDFSDYFPITTVYLPTQKSFSVALFDSSEINSFALTDILSQGTPSQCYTDKPNRKIEKIVTPETVSLLGTDVVGCLSTPLPFVSKDNLISFSFTYSSPTLTTGNVNITTKEFTAEDTSQPLEPSKNPKRVRLFINSTGSYQQLNLILEAEDTKSIQEITYKDVALSTHPLIFSTNSFLPTIPEKNIKLNSSLNRLQISLPSTNTQFDIKQTADSNSLFPEARNCDQFSSGKVLKEKTTDGLLYQSQNAIECDYLNLRHLSHSLNYLISFNSQYQKGLPLTTCLENHTTRRCDVFERLLKTNATQSIIQPIANSEENRGYTLHIFNQSVGNRVSANLLKSLTIRPLPLNFLQNISLSTPASFIPDSPSLRGAIETKQSPTIVSSTHPAEFLYTASIANDSSTISSLRGGEIDAAIPTTKSQTLNLYQTKSPYWKAVQVSEKDLKLPPWLITLEIFFGYPFLSKLPHSDESTWHNSWTLPEPVVAPSSASGGNGTRQSTSVVIIYLPQYLEFIGLALLSLPFLFFLARFVLKPKQSPPHKKPENNK